MQAIRTASRFRARATTSFANISQQCDKCKKPSRCFSTQQGSQTRKAPERSVAATVFFGSLCVLTASLGYWQAGRYQWKKELIASAKEKAQEAPIDVRSAESSQFFFSDSSSYRSRRLLIEGTFDHSKEILLGPRSSPVGMFGPAAQGLATNPQGYYVITPMTISSGKVIFVNRGWVPRTANSWSRPTEKVEMTVILMEDEKPNTFSPQNDPKAKRIFWMEKAALLEAAGIENLDQEIVVVDTVAVDGVAPPAGGPFPKPLDIVHEHYVQPETHLSYAFTWFSLTAIGAYLTYTRFSPRRIVRR